MTTETTTLSDLCKSLKIAPKLARVRLRAAEFAHNGRYEFSKAQLPKVTAIINGGDAPKAAAAKAKAPAKKSTKAKPEATAA
jgi:hypothetical protein